MNDSRLMRAPATPDVRADALQNAAAAGLVYVSDADPGIRRRRRGEEFVYVASNGRPLRDADALARIAKLAIPPAYEDVWICADPRGHLQATGRDARGRKQYRYHADWRVERDGAKFDRMVEFADSLPRLRRRLARDLARSGLPRAKVLATVVTLLDSTRMRVGNEEYARDNRSYGLTTLRNRHAQFAGDGRLTLRFRGKGGAEHEVVVDDRRLVRIVRHCQQLPGQLLFQYVADDGQRYAVDSGQVNAYLKETMGADFTAKDFRTWGATLRAIALLSRTPLPADISERARKRCIIAVVKAVADDLRNTPAVCRKSYINPVVFDAWREGALDVAIDRDLAQAPRKAERLALQFLRHRAGKSKPQAGRSGAHRAGAVNGARRPPMRKPVTRRNVALPLAA